MPRANRHFIPGYIWHITHICHKREFLLKFSKDRQRYLRWLYQARKRYGLKILNYMITSNHIHLLVSDGGDKDVIPTSIQLIAGRSGQEYNQRKKRKGAYWEDRYHATAVESGDHLARCIVYIDTNMVRAEVVFGNSSYDQLRSSHKGWIEEYLGNGVKGRQDEWTGSIAVRSKSFIETIKARLGFKAIGRGIKEGDGAYQLRESAALYGVDFKAKKSDIDLENTCLWDL